MPSSASTPLIAKVERIMRSGCFRDLVRLTFVCLVALACAFDHAAGAVIDAPSSLQVNLGPMPFDVYTLTNAGYVPNCNSQSTVRSCYQQILNNFRSQGVTGIRFQFAFRGAGNSTALTVTGGINQAWRTNVQLFFEDVRASQINNITIQPSFSGWLADQDEAAYTHSDNPCTTTPNDPITLLYWKTAPFGYTNTNPPLPYGAGLNNAYNCAPANPYFLGWTPIYSVINNMIIDAKAKSITVYQFDLFNEVDLRWFTVFARFIYDNKHGTTADKTVLTNIRSYMSASTFDPNRVTFSVSLDRTTVQGYDCGSIYGDSGRVYNVSALTAAIGGGLFGHPFNWNVTNNLACGGTPPTSGDLMVQLPASFTAPKIIDVHTSPCVLNASLNCDLTKPLSSIQAEANTSFTAIRNFMNSFGPSGWRGYNPNIYTAVFMLGETYSNTNTGSGVTCEQDATAGSSYTVEGFNQSTLGGSTTTVFRPWENMLASCYPTNLVINPPYSPAP